MSEEIQLIKAQKSGITVNTDVVFSYPIHTHSYYEMTLYMPFDGCIRINGVPHYPNAPMISLIAPSDLHVIEAADAQNARFIKIGFGSETLEKELRTVFSSVFENLDETDGVIVIFNEILKRGDCKYSACLINALVADIMKRGKIIKRTKADSKLSCLAALVAKINTDFHKDWSLKSLATELGITPQYLSRIFRGAVGEGFSEYLIRLRLERAGIYLKETNIPVTDIAYAVGYKDLSHFMRSFKRFYGMSPLVYRKKLTDRNGKGNG